LAFWAIDGAANRDQRCGESSPDQRLAFFEATKGLVPQAKSVSTM
jgi:hypothetical protein